MQSTVRLVGLRVTARLIDLALAGTVPAIFIFSIPRNAGLAGLIYVLLYLFVSAVWLFLVAPLVEALCVVRLSATPGMLVARLRLLDGGSPITLTRAAARSFLLSPLLLVSSMAYAVPAIVYAGWLCWDGLRRPDGRTWPDRVSGTTVVAARDKPVAANASAPLGNILQPPSAAGGATSVTYPPLHAAGASSATYPMQARSGRAVWRIALAAAAWVSVGVIRLATVVASPTAAVIAIVLIVAVTAGHRGLGTRAKSLGSGNSGLLGSRDHDRSHGGRSLSAQRCRTFGPAAGRACRRGIPTRHAGAGGLLCPEHVLLHHRRRSAPRGTGGADRSSGGPASDTACRGRQPHQCRQLLYRPTSADRTRRHSRRRRTESWPYLYLPQPRRSTRAPAIARTRDRHD